MKKYLTLYAVYATIHTEADTTGLLNRKEDLNMMKYYKGFDKDLKCRGFQYEEGKTYEEPEANLCESGFHACEAPLDVFNYYAPSKGSRYCEVELDGVSDQRKGDDTKVCAKKITVGEEIGIPELVKAHVEWVKERATEKVEKGDAEAASAGWRGVSSAGEQGVSSAGERGVSSAGDEGVSSAGEQGVSSAGERGVSASKGKSSVGREGIAAARGNGVIVKGDTGAVLVIVEENPDDYGIRFWKAFRIDGKRYKPDTWYTLDDDGKVVEFK